MDPRAMQVWDTAGHLSYQGTNEQKANQHLARLRSEGKVAFKSNAQGEIIEAARPRRSIWARLKEWIGRIING